MIKYNSVSLFTCAGIGDFGFKKAGISHIVMNELIEDRAQIAKVNFPEAVMINGDIRENIENIENITKVKLKEEHSDELFLLTATPPCQGMSKNGIGSILKAIREGKRAEIDERNYLFEPVIELVERLHPKYFFWENVDRMANMFVLNDDNEQTRLTDYIQEKLKVLGYIGEFRLINFADYGVPQNRQRMIGIFRRQCTKSVLKEIQADDLFPLKTHDVEGYENISKYRTVRETIERLPQLDSKNSSLCKSDFHPLHKVPVSREELYWWISNTKEGDTAYNNNECTSCGYVNNNEDVYCKKCKSLLPKPTVEKNGEIRLIKGFISAYKRMTYDKPSPTITTRSAYACSDNNLHPTQNRVFSIYEVSLLHGLNPEEYKWGPISKENKKTGKVTVKKIAPDTLLRDVLGEPVSPIFTEIVGKHLINIEKKINE
ncbi:MAG: DNA cytosine methyltransferase [Paraclostridium sp.]